MKILRSIAHTLSLVSGLAAQALVQLVRGDRRQAAEQLRALGIFAHDDLLMLLCHVQRAFGFGPGPATHLERILIVKLDRIGDMVNTTPVFDALRARYPAARIDIVGHPVPLSLLESDARVDGRFNYQSSLYHPLALVPPGPRSWKTLWMVLRARYQLVVYLRGSFPFLLLGLVAPIAAAKFLEAEPVIARYLKPLGAVLGPVTPSRPQLKVSPAANAAAGQLWMRGGSRSRGPKVILHAGASTGAKRWPVERFAKVADQLHQIYRADVHLVGSPSERPILEQIVSRAKHAPAVHANLPLPHIVAAISQADMFIGNDSGLGQIAAALNVPSILIWGPANLSMARPPENPGKLTILYRDLPCRRACPESYCVNDQQMQCLLDVEVNDVLAAADGMIGRRLALA